MNTSSQVLFKCCVITVLFCILFVSPGRCQDEDEDDEDTYDEELGDGESTTTQRVRRTTTIRSSRPASGQNETSSSRSSTVRTATRRPAQTPASAPAPAPTRATVRTTTESEYEDDEATTEEGYGYVFRPLNNLIDNIVAGNVTGIVDHALSIRTPPEIRAFVNNVMSNVFGAGIGKALRQFMPDLFSTQAPPTQKPGRDPIPPSPAIQAAVQQQPIPLTAVLTARSNATEEVNKSAKQQQPLQIALAHPGAPASRLRCEVIT